VLGSGGRGGGIKIKVLLHNSTYSLSVFTYLKQQGVVGWFVEKTEPGTSQRYTAGTSYSKLYFQM